MWTQYKDFAAQRVVEEQCPKCGCGIVGLPDDNRVECPNCSVKKRFVASPFDFYFSLAWILQEKGML